MAEDRLAISGFDRKRTGASYASQWNRFVSSVLMRPNHGTVHVMDFPVYLSGSVSLLLCLSQQPFP